MTNPDKAPLALVEAQDFKEIKEIWPHCETLEQLAYIYDCLWLTAQFFQQKGKRWCQEAETLHINIMASWSILPPPEGSLKLSIEKDLALADFGFTMGVLMPSSYPLRKLETGRVSELF